MNANRKIVAIHQPNFFPWLGYFDKIARSDIFILLDNVQFPKKGGTWSNRVQLVVKGTASWVTMPVVRAYHGTRTIKDMKIDNTTPWRDKILGIMQLSYSRAAFFTQIYPFLKDLVGNPSDSLAEYNKTAINALAKAVGLDTSKLVLGSSLEAEGSATDLLINLTRTVGGTAYLAGGGASGYQEDEKFAAAGIELLYQKFTSPVYPQCNATGFIPGLSIIDALMNVGFDSLKAMLTVPKAFK